MAPHRPKERAAGGEGDGGEHGLTLGPHPQYTGDASTAKCCRCDGASRDKQGWLRCRLCGEASHRACLGLRSSSLLGNSFTCEHCEAYGLCWEGGHGAITAARETSKAITRLEAEELEESTEVTYGSRLQQIRRWAVSAGYTEPDIFPTEPARSMPAVVAFGAVEWASWHAAPATLLGMGAAIGAWHKNKGVPNPMKTERGARVMKAARKRALRLGHKGRGAKAPITKEILAATHAWLDHRAQSEPEKAPLFRREQCWATLGFHGLLRRSELGSLRMRDVVVDKASKRVKVYIHKSKTDPGNGVWVWLAWETTTGAQIGETVQRWLGYRRQAGATAGSPLFTAWDRAAGQMTNRALQSKGQAMADMYRRHMQDMSSHFNMGLRVKDYGSHSLRRGGANAMKEAGWPPMRIQEHGRWTSDCYKRYLERSAVERMEVTRAM